MNWVTNSWLMLGLSVVLGQAETQSPVAFDFGDAPDPSYPTTLKNNGARHAILGGFHLGASVDVEPDGKASVDAQGDDAATAASADDENGVTFLTPLTPGQAARIAVIAPRGGRLDAWVDFNANGSWADAGEQILIVQALSPGTNTLSFAVPAGLKPGVTFSRFRLSLQGGLKFEGPAENGEVEDYAVKIEGELLDFGDAPEFENGGYPTTLARNGARHRIVQGFHLGRIEDGEMDGQPNLSATGDDGPAGSLDDEDGVRFLSALEPGTTAQVEVITSAGGRIDAWIDFGRNLNWTDPGDRIFTAQAVNAGVNLLSFAVPLKSEAGVVLARFRLSREGGLNFDGDGGPGEVEDYVASIEPAPEVACDLSCAGTEFWLTFPGNYAPDPANPVRPRLCVVGNAGSGVIVSIPGLERPFTISGTIPASRMLEVDLPASADLGAATDLIQKKGVHVVSTQPVNVYALSKVDYTSDGYLALPRAVLGTRYGVLAYANVHSAAPELNGSQFAVVACEDKTTVTIVPSVTTGVRTGGVPYTIVLQAGEAYQLRTTSGAPADLTGTRIQSDKPVAVFGSHSCANINSESEFFCDYLVEQLPPVNRWAVEFYTRRLATRSNGGTLRVLASQNNTVVSVDGSVVATLAAGEFFEAIRPAASGVNGTEIRATLPVLVAQYANSSDFDGVTNSDPFMSIVPGRSHYSRQHEICVPAGFGTSHINVIAPAGVAVTLDGVALGGFSPIGSSGMAQATAIVAPGIHRVSALQPIGVNVYGWNVYESYGWPSCLFFGDTTPPEVSCPPAMTVTLGTTANGQVQCEAVVPDLRGRVTFTDNCPGQTPGTAAGNVIVQEPPPGTLLGPGVHEIRFSVSDAYGNIGMCSTTFTVIESKPDPNAEPVLNCPENMTVACTDQNGARVEYKSFAMVGCRRVPLECKPASGSLFPVGTTRVTCVYPGVDSQKACSFTVTVVCRLQIDFKLDKSNLVLAWEGPAVLQVADSLFGPWKDLTEAKGSFVVDTTQSVQQFFRLR